MRQNTINCTHYFSTLQIFFTFLMWRAFSTWHCNVEKFSTWQYVIMWRSFYTWQIFLHGNKYQVYCDNKIIAIFLLTSIYHLPPRLRAMTDSLMLVVGPIVFAFCCILCRRCSTQGFHRIKFRSNSDLTLIIQTKENPPGIALATAADEQEVPGGVAPTHPDQDYHPDPWWSSRWWQSWWSSRWLQTWWLYRW